MKVIFLGCTKFSERMLRTIMQVPSIQIRAIFSIPETFGISYSDEKVTNYNYADLSGIADSLDVPFFEIDSGDGVKLTDFTSEIESYNADVILVMGWYYMVPDSIRSLTRLGAWGIHASLLPDYAGGAPLVWAIINGEDTTGVTLFRLGDGVDDGDIIRQMEFTIGPDETIREVYEKAMVTSENILFEVMNMSDQVTFTPQKKSEIKEYPQRSPEDGEIDMNWDGRKIYDFIRAQAPPYPGAFIRAADGKKIIIEKARLAED